ncbi:MAG: TRAP transporter small permease [Betaproteobacteria bacterium]|nr:MAG: TRAP transporter small permease [Betaproteobacteria bacterium]
MRGTLDRIYSAAAYLAALFLVCTLAMVLLGIFGRLFSFQIRGTDAYAGYFMAGAGFLALAHTLMRGEHIRVTLVLEHTAPRFRRILERWSLAVAALLTAAFAYFSVRLAWQSYALNDISTGNDATPLWIPQIAMAAGNIVLAIAFVDLLIGDLTGTRVIAQSDSEPAHVE